MQSPITGKEMSVVVREMKLNFRKESFDVSYPSYYCSDSGEYFTTTEFDNIKMKQVYNQYRDKYNLPFPQEIKDIRAKYKLSAVKMSEILGFGVNGYRNYENGEVPSQSNANLIQLANDPYKFKELVRISTAYEDNSADKKDLLARVDNLTQKKRDKIFAFEVDDFLLGDKLPDNYSGFVKPNIEKLSEMVVFFASFVEPFVTKLNKLLFYTDFLHYKYEAESISGTRYRAIDKGPVPNNYNSIYDFMKSNESIDIIEKEYDWGYSKKFVAIRDFDKSLFTNLELEILDKVKTKFDKMSTRQVVDYSHSEEAWIDNYHNGKSLIDYKYAFNLKEIS